MSLGWRLTLGVALIELVLLATLVLGMVKFLRDASLEGTKREARITAELFSVTASNAILVYDLATLDGLTEKIRSLPNVAFAYVNDGQGRRLSGSGDAEAAQWIEAETADELMVKRVDISSDDQVVGEFVAGFDLKHHNQTLAAAYRWGISFGLAEMVFVSLATLMLTCVLLREFKLIRERSTKLIVGEFNTPIRSKTRIPELRLISDVLETLRETVQRQFNQLKTLNEQLTAEVKQKECALEAERQHVQRNAEVFAVLGHEVRTPISVAVMLIKDPEFRQSRAAILENLEHALDLVDNLNYKANLDLNPGVTYKVLLSDALQELNIGLESLFASSKSKFSPAFLVEWDGELLLPVRYVSQIVRNLIKNAVLHSGARHISFNAATKLIDNDRVELTFDVRDDGIGIPPASMERIFLPYVRLDKETPGTGLGLSISKDLAEAIGAELTVESSKDGTIFRLLLIADIVGREDADNKSQQGSKNIKPSADPCDTLVDKSVLVVEDNLTIRLLTERILQKAGASVIVAEDGLDALSKFNDQIDLVLSDIHMPSMDGIELTAELRARYPDLTIIGVTAATIGDERTAMLEAGADRCIGKPFDLRNLVEILAELAEAPEEPTSMSIRDRG